MKILVGEPVDALMGFLGDGRGHHPEESRCDCHVRHVLQLERLVTPRHQCSPRFLLAMDCTACQNSEANIEPESIPEKISAYYSLVFPNFTYYLQTLSVTIGRRCIPSAVTTSDPSPVDVDLGPLKSVSRLHARIEYEEEEERFVLVVIGRNGAWVDGVWSGSGSRVFLSERYVLVDYLPILDITRYQFSNTNRFTYISFRATTAPSSGRLAISELSVFLSPCTVALGRYHFYIPSFIDAFAFPSSNQYTTPTTQIFFVV
jgi:hypothetical protein